MWLAPRDISRTVVRDKSDLEARRKATAREGADLAASLGAPFIEALAKTDARVDDVSEQVAREMVSAMRAKDKDTATFGNNAIRLLPQTTGKGACVVL